MLQISSKTGMAVIVLHDFRYLNEAVDMAMAMEDRTFHRAEIIIAVDDKIIEVSAEKVKAHGRGTRRAFKITDPRWRIIEKFLPEIKFIVKSRGWYFSMEFDPSRDWDGTGCWYSAQMMRGAYGEGIIL